MKKQFNTLLNEANTGRVKIYYRLNQLEEITGLSARSLKYRMKTVKEKYQGATHLLSFVGRAWKIHYTLIGEFLPKRKTVSTTILNHPWQTLITWNMLERYDVNYHKHLIEEVKAMLPTANIAYAIEKDSRGNNHLHAITDELPLAVSAAVDEVVGKYLEKKQYRSQIEKIKNSSSTAGYLRKSNSRIIII